MMKTSELILIGKSLDYVVATITKAGIVSLDGNHLLNTAGRVYSPSTDWAQGGPIIESMKIETRYDGRGAWCAWMEGSGAVFGSTPLIAAMRCFVASKLGDEIEIPKEFL